VPRGGAQWNIAHAIRYKHLASTANACFIFQAGHSGPFQRGTVDCAPAYSTDEYVSVVEITSKLRVFDLFHNQAT
jgi:hypothetical protein